MSTVHYTCTYSNALSVQSLLFCVGCSIVTVDHCLVACYSLFVCLRFWVVGTCFIFSLCYFCQSAVERVASKMMNNLSSGMQNPTCLPVCNCSFCWKQVFLSSSGSVSVVVASVGHLHAGGRTTAGCYGLQPHQAASQFVFCFSFSCFVLSSVDCWLCVLLIV